MKKLRALDIRCCQQIGDKGLEHLKDMTNLRTLKVRNGNDGVTDAGLICLKGLTKLRNLSFEDTA